MSFVTDTTTKEKFWNAWTGAGWYINLGRTHADGEKTKTDTWNPNQTIPQNLTSLAPGRKYSTDGFLWYLCTRKGRKESLLLTGEGTLQLIQLFCYFEVYPMWGTNVHSFLWTMTLYVVLIWFCLYCEVFPLQEEWGLWPVLLAKRKEKNVRGH